MSNIRIAHVKVKLDATLAPTATDDSGLGYAVGSRWVDVTNNKEYVCVDSTVSSAIWVETTGSGSGGPHVDNFTWFESASKPYADTTSVTYTIIDRIIFRGTSFDTPTAIKFIANVEDTYTGSFKIYDVTNSLDIGEVSFTDSAFAIINLGTLSNLSSGEAIWEIQIKTNTINRDVQTSSMRIEY